MDNRGDSYASAFKQRVDIADIALLGNHENHMGFHECCSAASSCRTVCTLLPGRLAGRAGQGFPQNRTSILKPEDEMN